MSARAEHALLNEASVLRFGQYRKALAQPGAESLLCDKIAEMLLDGPMTRTALHNLFSRRVRSGRLTAALIALWGARPGADVERGTRPPRGTADGMVGAGRDAGGGGPDVSMLPVLLREVVG
jgi:hypothetical protein